MAISDCGEWLGEAHAPPCLALKRFLVHGDAACTVDYYYCFDCGTIWVQADECMGYPAHWALGKFEHLCDPGYWRHGVVENNYPAEAFVDGKTSFAAWVRGLDGPEWAVGPV